MASTEAPTGKLPEYKLPYELLNAGIRLAGMGHSFEHSGRVAFFKISIPSFSSVLETRHRRTSDGNEVDISLICQTAIGDEEESVYTFFRTLTINQRGIMQANVRIERADIETFMKHEVELNASINEALKRVDRHELDTTTEDELLDQKSPEETLLEWLNIAHASGENETLKVLMAFEGAKTFEKKPTEKFVIEVRNFVNDVDPKTDNITPPLPQT